MGQVRGLKLRQIQQLNVVCWLPKLTRMPSRTQSKTLHGVAWWRREQNAMGVSWKKELLRLHKRKNLFCMRSVRQWSRFPREAVQSLSLEMFKIWLDTALSNLVWPHCCSCFEQEVGIKTSWAPFQPEWVCDSVTGSCYFDQLQGSESGLLCDSIFPFLEQINSIFQTEVLKSLQHAVSGWSGDNSGASVQMSIAIFNALGYLALSPATTTEAHN